jgi:hypothetical protein
MLKEKQIIANQEAMRFNLLLEKFVQDNIYSDFSCKIKLDWSYSRRSSRGGIYKDGPGVNIAMSSAALIEHDRSLVYRFYEYPSYDNNPVIGGFYAKDYLLKLQAVVAHEVAHAVQFFEYSKLKVRCKPHGPIFKKYYSLFRTTFINSKLPEQRILQKTYEEEVSKIKSAMFSCFMQSHTAT